MVKRGFSLAEALVVMGIISVFFGVAAKISFAKPKTIQDHIPHGYYECYKDGRDGGGGYSQRYVLDGIPSDPEFVNNICTFTPPKEARYFAIRTYGTQFVYDALEPEIETNISMRLSLNSLQVTRNGRSYEIKADENKIAPSVEQQRAPFAYLKHAYPDSQIYNNGADNRMGVMISW